MAKTPDSNLSIKCREAIEKAQYKSPADYELPNQDNMYNCGVWVATYIKNILK
jgi:Ulp1 family protease